jgi:amidohydrolase
MTSFQENLAEYVSWRHALHQHPQTAYEEVFAGDFVAEKLAGWGISVHRNLGKTGIVGVLHGKKEASRAIGLRADMDALNIEERTNLPYGSKYACKMHACGHDGHTTALLAAAQYLSQTRHFSGTVHFIFQPAEEGAGGALAMMHDGLFERFPCDSVYSTHNWPDLPLGQAGVCVGPILANADQFKLRIVGRGGHAAFPHNLTDSVLCSAHIITALQSLVARNLHPFDAGVVSVSTIHAGESFNVIPESVELGGTVRSFKPDVQQSLKDGIFRIAQNVCRAFSAEATEYEYRNVIEATVNTPKETGVCVDVLGKILGQENVDTKFVPTMGGDDFGSMIKNIPGCYVFLGCRDDKHPEKLHSPYYDYNDALIPIGANYWVKLVETALSMPQ